MFRFWGSHVRLFFFADELGCFVDQSEKDIERLGRWRWFSFGTKDAAASQIRTTGRRIFCLLIGISFGRVRRFSTGFYGERPDQNQRTEPSIRTVRINEALSGGCAIRGLALICDGWKITS